MVRISKNQKKNLEHMDISVCDNLDRIRKLSGAGIEVLICGAISRLWYDILTAWAIRVICFVTGDVDQVLEALKENRLDLDEYRMPGCPQYMRERNLKIIQQVVAGLQNQGMPALK